MTDDGQRHGYAISSPQKRWTLPEWGKYLCCKITNCQSIIQAIWNILNILPVDFGIKPAPRHAAPPIKKKAHNGRRLPSLQDNLSLI